MSATRHSLRRAVQRALVLRVGLAALGLAAVLGVITYFVIDDEIGDGVVALARRQVERFYLQGGSVLEGPRLPEQAVLERELGAFSRTQPQHDWGEFVLVNIRDLDQRLVAQTGELESPRLAEAIDALVSLSPGHLAQDDFDSHSLSVAGHRYILIQQPMRNLGGQQVGWIEAAFELSEETLDNVDKRVLRGVASVVAIVLLTALLLYPIVTELVRRLTRSSANLLEANLNTLQVVGAAVAKRDNETQAHSARVTLASVRLAEHLGLSEDQIRQLIKGALLHDVGKIAIHDEILLKSGRLTAEEFETMKTHVAHGAEIVQGSAWLTAARDVVQYHHEKFDGSGYLAGLVGDEIPHLARIFALADVFDALTSKRPYKEARSLDETMVILEDSRGSHFDPQLLDAFETISAEVYRDIAGRHDAALDHDLAQAVRRYFSAIEALEP